MSGPDEMTDEEYLRWATESDPLGPGAPAPAAPAVDPSEAAYLADLESEARRAEDPSTRAYYEDLAAEARRTPADRWVDAAREGGPVVAMPAPLAGPAAAPPASMSPEEAALWRAAAGLPPLGSGSVSLPGAPVAPSYEAPAAPWGSPGALRSPPVAAPPAAPGAAPTGTARRRATAAASPGAPAPVTEADVNATLIDALTNRPRDAPSLFGEYDNRSETGLDRDLRLNADAGRLETRRAELMGIAAAEERDRVEAEIAARQAMEMERRAATTSARDSYRRAQDRAASLSIDPDGFYHSRGVGGTIASAIAIGLGGLSSAVQGGPNVVLDMINQEIERDLQAQQQRIDSAFRRADAEGTLYDMTRQEYADRGSAFEAARALALENVAAQVAEREAALGSEEARHNAEVMAAQLRDAAAASRAEAERAEIEWQLRMRLLDARARERAAAAQRAEHRAAAVGGPAAPSYEEPTTARLDAANRLIDSGSTPERAAEAVGIDPSLIGGAPRFAELSGGTEAAEDARLSAALDRLEALVPSRESGEDVPGVGMTGAFPAFMLTDEGRRLREEAENVIDLLGRSRTGANMPESELATYRRLLLGAAETDEGLRAGIARLRDMIAGGTSRTREGRTADEVDMSALTGTSARRVED